MDWITLLIELVGLTIVIAFIVIPVKEFAQIFRAVKDKPPIAEPAVRSSADEGHSE